MLDISTTLQPAAVEQMLILLFTERIVVDAHQLIWCDYLPGIHGVHQEFADQRHSGDIRST